MIPNSEQLNLVHQKLKNHLLTIYGSLKVVPDTDALATELLSLMRLDKDYYDVDPDHSNWDQTDIALITYADSVITEGEIPLQTLNHFLNNYVKGTINNIHILPFFPFCSDDGFAVVDYYQVNPPVGDWSHINTIAQDYHLMADLVINHGSSSSEWFQNFIKGEGEGCDYFYTADADTPVTQVVRPRTSPLLRQTETATGTQYVWCTFSHEQVDFDFTNIKVLKEFITIIRHYLDNGIRTFRLDAVAFLWKKLGTDCLNLPETHEVVRLIRTLLEHAQPNAIIITETNIPNRENLSYFGNANEAHSIYNFSLPPLLVNTLITGNCRYLKQWLMSMPPAQNKTTYFNFIASHDGIGLRPAEGLLNDSEVASFISTMQSFGGKVSWRAGENGIKKPYEVNIALFDALQGTHTGTDEFGLARFICAHAIILALEGIPAIYIHSLVATHNDDAKFERSQENRSINRHQWDYSQLQASLADSHSDHHQSYQQLKQIISIRKQQTAFHPNATQFTLHLNEQLFGFWRQSIDRNQSIFCIYNISNEFQSLLITDLNLIITDTWHDLISGLILDDSCDRLELAPYQTLWISNTKNSAIK